MNRVYWIRAWKANQVKNNNKTRPNASAASALSVNWYVLLIHSTTPEQREAKSGLKSHHLLQN